MNLGSLRAVRKGKPSMCKLSRWRMGGDARVGLEDSLFVGKEGQLATSTAEQVKEVVQIADALGREVATPDDARNLLGLKGLDKVGF